MGRTVALLLVQLQHDTDRAALVVAERRAVAHVGRESRR